MCLGTRLSSLLTHLDLTAHSSAVLGRQHNEEVLAIMKLRCLRSHLTEREDTLQSIELEETTDQKDKQIIQEVNKQEAAEHEMASDMLDAIKRRPNMCNYDSMPEPRREQRWLT